MEELLADTDAGMADPGELDRQRAERLQVFGQSLQTRINERIAEKAKLEERWLEDLRQYNGEYDPETKQRIKDNKGSEAFVNLTRVKCNAGEARLSEMLLPTDDRNWSIEPTPIPSLLPMAKDRSFIRDETGQPVTVGGRPVTPKDVAESELKEAKTASDLMQKEMDDQLEECSFNAVSRSVIHYATVYGTGILKGPVIRNRAHTTFRKDPQSGRFALTRVEDLRPGAECVNPWDFFPDMRATRMEDCEDVIERHRMTKKELRELARLPGFDAQQINDLLKEDPNEAPSGLVAQADSDAMSVRSRYNRYEVWEYHGPICKEDLEAAGLDVDPDDYLTEHQGTVWFCRGRVLKVVLSMLDDGELMYDAFPFERDDTSVFGFGVPYMMRHSQRVANAAWRMVLDNARMTVGPQVVIKGDKIVPLNGDYTLAPMKVWKSLDPSAPVEDAFAVFNVTPNFAAMFEIFAQVRLLTDEETGLPMIAQGQQSPGVTKTAQGMSILMNSANTVLRRLVKQYDDEVTRRFITRLYHWNMQYSDREEIKGDYNVVALGSSSLLVKEQQTEGLMQLAALAGTNPHFAERTKWDELYRKIVQAMNINADGLVKTEEEVEMEAQAQQPQMPPEIELRMAELEIARSEQARKDAEFAHQQQMDQFDMQLANAEAQADAEESRGRIENDRQKAAMAYQSAMANAQARAYQARTQMEVALARIAAERQMSVEDARKQLGVKAMDIDSKHQLFNAEAALKVRQGSGI